MQPTLYIPHGGGPLPVLGNPSHTALIGFLSKAARRIPERPKGILLVSAHWEEDHPQLTSSPNPGLLYDYYGFPPESYSLQYPAPGDPQLAQQAVDLLKAAGFKASLNPDRAFDHGAFIPLMLMYPEADIPVVQLSLNHSLDPDEHYAMGEALAPLRSQGVLLLGSGMSFHSLPTLRSAMRQSRHEQGPAASELAGQDFNTWLLDACLKPPGQRRQLLAAWAAAPGARAAHPREEHLIPLMVVAGAAAGSSSSSEVCGDAAGHVVWDGECMGAAVSALGFGDFVDEQE